MHAAPLDNSPTFSTKIAALVRGTLTGTVKAFGLTAGLASGLASGLALSIAWGLAATSAQASLYSDSTAIFRFDATLCLMEDVPVHAAPVAGSPVLFQISAGEPPRQIHVYGATPDEAWAEIYENQTLGYISAGALEWEGCWTPASQPAGPTLYEQLPEDQWP